MSAGRHFAGEEYRGDSRVKVSADGHGVLSHVEVGMLREVAELTGLSAQVTAVLADTYRRQWSHAPGAVFADLAAAVAVGADGIVNLAVRVTAGRMGDRDQRRFVVQGLPLPEGDHQPRCVAVSPLRVEPA